MSMTPGRRTPGRSNSSSRRQMKQPLNQSNTFSERDFDQTEIATITVPEVDDNGPGPGGFTGLSSVGAQATSTRRTNHGFGFGSNPRSKLSMNNSDMPGPGAYGCVSSIGSTFDSTKPSAPQFTMRAREAFGSTVDKNKAMREPGPGQYSSKVVNPKERNAPHYSFNSNPRTNEAQRARVRPKTPGPGSYRQSGALGKQPLSSKRQETQFSFGHAPRYRPPASWVDKGGVDHYAIVASMGRQRDSTKKTKPAWGFGTGQRGAARSGGVNHRRPGPGTYGVNKSMGTQALSQKTSSPACSMAGRTAFGSPYGRFPNAWA